ncbi:MAG TPA: hypothetical protein VGK53_15295 [Propionicimonas sp.]|jgi:hypothetical protein
MVQKARSAWQAGGGALALCLLCWAAGPAVPALAAPVDGWRPVDKGVTWTGPEITPVPADAVAGCAGQRSRWDGGSRVVTLIVLDCTDAGSATSAVTAILADSNYSPVADASPVLGEGFDVVVRTAAGNVDRYWSQGTTYVGVGTSCQDRDCAAATARYARELSGLVGGRPNPLWPAPVTGPVSSFRPSGGPWLQVRDAVLPSTQLRVTDCAEAQQLEWRSAGRVAAMASVVDCGTPELAFRAWGDLWATISTRPADGGAVAPGMDAAGSWDVGDGRIGFARAWVQGGQYVYVHRICEAADVAACNTATAADARAIASLVPGELRPDNRGINLAVRVLQMLVLFPLLTMFVLVLARAIWRRSQDGGWSVSPASTAFQAVDRQVRRAQFARWVRTVVVAILVVGCYAGGVMWMTSLGNTIAFAVWMFGGPIVLIPILTGLVRLAWPPHPLARIARGPRIGVTAGSVAGAGLRAGASGFAALALLGYAICAVLLLLVSWETPDSVGRNVASLLTSASPLEVAFGLVFGLVAQLESRGLAPLLFLAVLAGPMTMAYLLNRLGKRLSQRSLQALLAADTRPHILYLRGFEEDKLRVTPSLTRSGFLQWLTPFGRPRFEEVLVRYLSRFGPVIAVSGHQGRALQELGAAKATFSGGEWQQQVHTWMRDALFVVVAATPTQVRDGLMWELVQLSDDERRARVLLVTSPWPREQLRARWRGFLEATAGLPLFAGLGTASFPDGVQVMTWTSDAGWRGYGARRRWDWSYAASLVAAIEDAAATWNRDRAAEKGNPIEPDEMPTRAAADLPSS